jgi:hypothetical protein
MAKKFLVNLDLAKNQILNAAIQNLSSAPSSPVQGQVYYNTGDNRIYFWDGTAWIDMSGDIRDVIGGAGLTAATSNGIITLDVNVDNSTVEIVSDAIRVKDGGITTAKLANVSTDLATNSGTTAVPTALAVKTYVDGVAAGLGNLEGGWDLTTATSFPFVTSPAVIKKGDYWYATTNGIINTTTITGIAIEIGDVMIANKDNADGITYADWIILQTNKDQATETTLGLVRIADQTAVNTGTDDTEAITPLKLKTYLDANVGGYTTLIGNGASTSFNVIHGLNTAALIIAVYDNATGEEVMVDIVNVDSIQVIVSFAVAPSTNAYRVVIKK